MGMLREWLSGLPSHIEVCLRVSFASCCGYALSVADIPRVVPTSLSFMVGIIAAVVSISVPCLLFGIGAACPTFITSFLLALAGSSVLLAAATVSDGCFVGVVGAFTMWLAGLRHGPDRDKTEPYGRIGIVIAGFMALSFYELVKNGFNFTIDTPPDATDPNFELLQTALSAICTVSGQIENCWESQLPLLDGTLEIVVTGNSIFAGQVAYITTTTEGSINILIDGGLWIVAGLWTWSGLTNPLANNRNFIITVCLALACVAVGILIPPLRTARSALTRAVIPKALGDVSALCRNGSNNTDVRNVNGEVEGDGTDTDEMNVNVNEEAQGRNMEEMNASDYREEHARDMDEAITGDEHEDEAQRGGSNTDETNADANEESQKNDEGRLGRLIHFANVFAGGKIAALTAFEPRLCTAPFECTWPKLMELLEQIEREIYGSIAVDALHLKDMGGEEAAAVANIGNLLDTCAAALTQNQDPSEKLEALLTSDEVAEKDDSFDTIHRFERRSQKVLAATIAWLNAMLHPESPLPCKDKAGLKNVVGTYALWFMPPYKVVTGLLNTLILPFRPKLWNLKGFLFAFKWTAGFVALVCMTVLWNDYSRFAVDVDGGGVAALYKGWSLIAYGFCWSPTLEGTVKLSLLRALGTCLGAFGAWLGLIVCAGSYSADAEINPFGIVAWLTVSTGLATFFSVERGFAAHLGLKADHGKAGFYFVLTQAIIALQVEQGIGTRDDLVVNRLIANLCGCLLAMMIALIPPHFKGNDPKFVRDLLVDIEESLQKCLRLLIGNETNESADIEKEKARFYEKKVLHTKLALYFIKDASALKRLPMLKVDPMLTVELEELSMIGFVVLHLFSFASYISKKENLKCLFLSGTDHCNEITKIIKQLGRETKVSAPHEEIVDLDEQINEEQIRFTDAELAAAKSGRDEAATFMVLLNETMRSLEAHERMVASIESSHRSNRRTIRNYL